MPKVFKFITQWSLIGVCLAIGYLLIQRLQPGPHPLGIGGDPSSYASAVATAMPSVVSIHTATAVRRPSNPLLSDPLFQEFFSGPSNTLATEYETSLGSGVIVANGLVLTNYHVVNGVDRIELALFDGRRGNARVLGVDPEADLAVLNTDLALPQAIRFAATDKLKIGDVALAIGNPLGIGLTVTQGIISATGRDRIGINAFENFIQTDAAINPGNSGGALVDVNGELIGINAAILGYQGIGFAIPADMARSVLRELVDTGEVTRGWLGIEARDLSAQLRQRFNIKSKQGILVLSVLPQGPAALAGIRPGDVIFEIDGAAINDSRQALNAIARLKPANETLLGVERERSTLALSAMVQSRPRIRPN